MFAKTDCVLIGISTQNYKNLMQFAHKRKEAELVVYMRSLPLFKSMAQSHLKKLVNKFKPVFKEVNSVLYREGETASHVYIVLSGEFKVTKRLKNPNLNLELGLIDIYKNVAKAQKEATPHLARNVKSSYTNVQL